MSIKLLEPYLVCSDFKLSEKEAYDEIQAWIKDDPDSTEFPQFPEAIQRDLRKYKMKNVFGYNPPVILQSYIDSGYSDYYFMSITGIDHNDIKRYFINNIEKSFYLTHGYGRPNLNINYEDLQVRNFLNSCCPTSFILLSSVTKQASEVQNINDIKNSLSNVLLCNIEPFILSMMERINKIFRGKLVAGDDFRKFLRQLGILPLTLFDSTTDVYRCNLSEILLYRSVIPERVFSFTEIEDRETHYIQTYINTLPDSQLLSILKINNVYNWNPSLLRSLLVDKVMNKYIKVNIYVDYDTVYSKRGADSKCKTGEKNKFFEKIKSEKVFHNGDELFSIEGAKEIDGLTIEETALFDEVADTTRILNEESKEYITRLNQEEKCKISSLLIKREFKDIDNLYVYTKDGHITSMPYSKSENVCIESVSKTLSLLN